MNYEEWEEERQRLWDNYKAHYLQAQGGIKAAFPYVFEHATREAEHCSSIMASEDARLLTDQQNSLILEVHSMSTNVIEGMITDGSVTLDARPADVSCSRCNREKRGFKVYIKLPGLGNYLQDEFCTTCA